MFWSAKKTSLTLNKNEYKIVIFNQINKNGDIASWIFAIPYNWTNDDIVG